LEKPEAEPPAAAPVKPGQTQHLRPVPTHPAASAALPAINPAGFVKVEDSGRPQGNPQSDGLKLPVPRFGAEPRFQGSILPAVLVQNER
jgi:hypothetical protein